MRLSGIPGLWVTIYIPVSGMFEAIISSTIFSCTFFYSSSSGNLVIWTFFAFNVIQRSLKLSSFILFYFIKFFFFSILLCSTYFYHFIFCKTQNSGLCSKEEKPRDPMNQSSRCNTQEGLLSVAQTRWLWSPGRQSTRNSKLGKLL